MKKWDNRQRVICFDMDGVIIHTMPLHAEAWMQAVRQFNLSVSRTEIYQWEGEPGTVTAHRLLDREDKSQQLGRALLKYKEQYFMKLAIRVRIAPGWTGIIKRLAKRDIRTALVTGTSHKELRRMLPNTFIQNFHTIITGDQVKRGKPHPESYQSAFFHLNVPSHKAIVVENAPYGIQSAIAARAGMVTALTSSLSAQYLHGADLIFNSSRALQKWLSQILG